jgi:putative peptidoglycan lipid II flippase
VVMVLGFVTNSFQMNALLSFTAIGASIGTYALLWFNLPYAVFAVPVTTVLFTELSDYFASDDMESFKDMVMTGTGKLAFALVPFVMFLAVFSPQLVTLISAGRFDADAAAMCALYLAWRAPSLPFYGVGMYLQKVCSATRKMELYAGASVVCGIVQILLLQLVAPSAGLWLVPFTSCVFYAVFDVIVLIALRRSYGNLGIRKMLVGVVRSVLFGLVGSAVAIVILHVASPLIPTGEVMKALLLCVVAGIPAVMVTYGTATLLKVPEASTVTTVINRLLSR